jgi:uncharacterized protein (TIGR03067 family)
MRHAILVPPCAVLALILPTLVLASEPRSLAQEKAEKKELAALQGAWAIVGKEFMSIKASEKEVKKLTGKTVIKGNKITEWAGEPGKEKIMSESTFKLNRAAKPKTMDLKYTRGVLKGDAQLAVYELEGDTLKVCYSFGKGEKRPTEFAGKLDGKALFLTYKRLVLPDPD